MPDGDLGGATFVVSANMEPLEQQLQRAESISRQATTGMAEDWRKVEAATRAAADRIAANIAKVEEAGRRAEEALAMGGGGRGFGNPALGLLAISQAVEDAQYGFAAIVNNIPMIVMGLGGGPGLAGAASLAAVAISQLNQHVGDLRDILQGAWLGVPAEELARIRQNAEEAAEAFDKLMQMRPKSEEGRNKGVIGAIQEADPEKVMTATREAIMRDQGGLKPELRPGDAADIMKRAMGKAMFDTEEKGWKALVEEAKGDILQERAEAETKRILGDLTKHGPEGDRARQDMARLQKANPNTPLPNLEGIEQQQVMDEWLKMEKLQSEMGMRAVQEKEKEEKEGKKAAKEQKKIQEDFARQMEADEKRATLEVLRDQKEEMQEEMRRKEHALTPAGRQQLRDEVMGSRSQQNSQILSTKQYVDKVATGALSQIPKEQLDTLKKMHDNLKSIDKKIADITKLH